MKKILFLFCFAGFLIGCQSCDSTNSKVPTKKNTVKKKNYEPDGQGLGVRPKPQEAPNLDSRMKHVVNKYWWYEGYVSSRPAVTAERRGHWYYYYDDGTFMYGKFQKELGYGTWRYVTVNGSETLYNRSEDGSETLQWETMISNTNDKLVWMGPAIGPNKGDQGMLQPYLQKPTEKDIFWAKPKIETREVVEDDPLSK